MVSYNLWDTTEKTGGKSVKYIPTEQVCDIQTELTEGLWLNVFQYCAEYH